MGDRQGSKLPASRDYAEFVVSDKGRVKLIVVHDLLAPHAVEKQAARLLNDEIQSTEFAQYRRERIPVYGGKRTGDDQRIPELSCRRTATLGDNGKDLLHERRGMKTFSLGGSNQRAIKRSTIAMV